MFARIKNSLLVVSACLPAMSWPLSAVSAEEATRLDTVTVTGEALEEDNSYRVETDEVPEIVPDTASLLNRVPGADVNRNGVLTGIAQYRGLYGDRVNVKINGATIDTIDMNGVFFGTWATNAWTPSVAGIYTITAEALLADASTLTDQIVVTVGTQLGDVSCDFVVNVVDALFIMQYDVALRSAVSSCPLPADSMNLTACDVSGDATCNVVDALFVMQCDVGIANPFCPAASFGDIP